MQQLKNRLGMANKNASKTFRGKNSISQCSPHLLRKGNECYWLRKLILTIRGTQRLANIWYNLVNHHKKISEWQVFPSQWRKIIRQHYANPYFSTHCTALIETWVRKHGGSRKRKLLVRLEWREGATPQIRWPSTYPRCSAPVGPALSSLAEFHSFDKQDVGLRMKDASRDVAAPYSRTKESEREREASGFIWRRRVRDRLWPPTPTELALRLVAFFSSFFSDFCLKKYPNKKGRKITKLERVGLRFQSGFPLCFF